LESVSGEEERQRKGLGERKARKFVQNVFFDVYAEEKLAFVLCFLSRIEKKHQR
jgi:hypothetical protein